MTQELADAIINNSTRCTQATLRAFGVEGYPLLGSGCLSFLTNYGFKLIRIDIKLKRMRDIPNKLDMNKNYLINTKRHAMALVNGILVDTEKKGFDSRKIEFIWEVMK